jgi:hypothetical protein
VRAPLSLSLSLACKCSLSLTRAEVVLVRASWVGVGVATVLCVAFATVGYLAFGPATEGNILNNFDDDDDVINAARVALAFTMVFTYPFAFTVVRTATARMLGWEDDDRVRRDALCASGACGARVHADGWVRAVHSR